MSSLTLKQVNYPGRLGPAVISYHRRLGSVGKKIFILWWAGLLKRGREEDPVGLSTLGSKAKNMYK